MALYEKDTYLNKNIDKVSNSIIIEYDLKSANTSLCREYELLPESIITEIENMPKSKRVVAIGKLQRKDKEFTRRMKESFSDIRRRFFMANNIQEEDVLAIKKDAIFCLKEVPHTDFGSCHFSDKNRYSSYMYLNKFEFYYRSSLMGDGELDVKGIDDTILKKHDGFMNDFFLKFFKHLESSSVYTQLSFLKNFIDKYKHCELEVGYYREYNQRSMILLNDMDEEFDDPIFIPFNHKQEHVNIDYNFFNILLPLLKMIL